MRNIVVIGGSSGIGKEIVQILSNSGNGVFATYRNTTPEISSGNVEYQFLDVTEDEIKLNLPDEIHGLVYCPGTINLKPFSRIRPESFLKDYEIQVVGAIKIIQELLPKLKVGGASVVMFSTVAVQKGFNFHSQVSASKGAIEGLTRSLAAELAPTIRINCIAPSLTDTPLAGKLLNTEEKRHSNGQRHPLKRIGTPADIAEATSFLLSDKSSWVTGQIIHIDGGMSSINN
ncbi:MAG: SDR family oxidoreductase [Bacteroidia bacterium]|nr:SDR family oxidoreductase [Bacteroidia bacterium]